MFIDLIIQTITDSNGTFGDKPATTAATATASQWHPQSSK